MEEMGDWPLVATIWTELDRGFASFVKSCGTCRASASPVTVWVLGRLFDDLALGFFFLGGFERLFASMALSGSIRWLKGRNALTDGMNGFGVTFVSSAAFSFSTLCPCSLYREYLSSLGCKDST